MQNQTHNTTLPPLANQAEVPLKAVLILGIDVGFNRTSNITQYQKQFQSGEEGYLLIGDAVKELDALDDSLLKLKGRIDSSTRIYILAHGNAQYGVHFIDKKGFYTGNFLEKIAQYSEGKPLSIQVISCYSGAAASTVLALPAGSVLVTHSPNYTPILADLGEALILESSKDVSRDEDVVHDLLRRFTLNIKQTATISIHKSDGALFKHTIRFKDSNINPASPLSEVIRYLELKRLEFIQVYNQEFGHQIDPKMFPSITETEARQWKFDYINYQNTLNRLSAFPGFILPEVVALTDYINYQVRGKTPLMIAATKDNFHSISDMLKLPGVDINARDEQGYTALMAASINGNYQAVSALLVSGKVTAAELAMKNKQGYTAFMMAVIEGHHDVIQNMFEYDAVKATAELPNSEGKTALMLAEEIDDQITKRAASLNQPKKTLVYEEIAITIVNKIYAGPFYIAILQNDERAFNKILPSITKYPFAMKWPFLEAIRNGRDTMFKEMLPHMLQFPDTMKEAFIKMVEQDKVAMLKEMLPHMLQFPDVMGAAFIDIIKHDKSVMFKEILPHMLQSREAMSAAFIMAVKHNRSAMFKEILPHMLQNPDVMIAAFKDIVKIPNYALFKEILPHILGVPATMNAAFIETIKAPNYAMYKEMLPHMINNPAAMELAFEESVKYAATGMLMEILPSLKPDSSAMKKVFLWAIARDSGSVFNNWPVGHRSRGSVYTNVEGESFLKFDGSTSNEDGNWTNQYKQELIISMLSYIDPIPSIPSTGSFAYILDIVKNDDELFVNVIEKGKKNNPKLVGELQAILPEMLKNPDVKQQLLAAATKAGNQEILDNISESERVNIHIASTPPSPELRPLVPAGVPNLPSVPDVPTFKRLPNTESQHSFGSGSMSATPLVDATLTLVTAVAAKLRGGKIPGEPAKFNMPSFIEQPPQSANAPGSWVSTVTPQGEHPKVTTQSKKLEKQGGVSTTTSSDEITH